MAPKKPLAVIKIELEAGNAAMVDLGKALGPHGVATMEVKRRYDADTARHAGEIIPAIVSVYDDRSWDLRTTTPPTAFLIKQVIRRDGAARPGHQSVATITARDLEAIARRKLPDLNTTNIQAAIRQIEGTARSMGVRVTR
ncbi:uL11 family ribosomal protein [Phytoactinopolyspora limicola]|uniref:uL11 family ribosomal protein n=1 Tax=Phytoactinopolyspora limicola TaxID=2715536 RepID=UPI00140DBCCB|nr:50S ribosomal protein L11 [Phytoactinopolyspora limicola]